MSNARLLAAVAIGICLGVPIRAWSSPDLCEGVTTTTTYETANLSLTSVSVDNAPQPLGNYYAASPSIGSPDPVNDTVANLPALAPDAGVRELHLHPGTL